MEFYLEGQVISSNVVTERPSEEHYLTRTFHESPAATADMGVLPGVLGP